MSKKKPRKIIKLAPLTCGVYHFHHPDGQVTVRLSDPKKKVTAGAVLYLLEHAKGDVLYES